MRVENGFQNKKKGKTCKSKEICEKNEGDIRKLQTLEFNPKNVNVRKLSTPTASVYHLWL